MGYRITRAGEAVGTFEHDEVGKMFESGSLVLTDVVTDETSGKTWEMSTFLSHEPASVKVAPEVVARQVEADPARAAEVVRRLARYERISAVVWLLIAICQILAVVTALAGLWNIFASISRFRMAKAIEARNPGVPAAYEEGLTWLIVMGVVNLVLGGVFAVVWIGFDWYVRSRVLANRHVFENAR